jgi:hypothetical protein
LTDRVVGEHTNAGEEGDEDERDIRELHPEIE